MEKGTNEIQESDETFSTEKFEGGLTDKRIEESSDNVSLYSKYNVLVQTIKDGLILIKDGRVRYSNKVFTEMLGYTVEELLNIKIENFIAPNYINFVLERYDKRLKSEIVPTQYEIEAVRKNGKSFPVLLNVGLVSSGTDQLEFVIVRDLSEISLKNNELKKRESEFETIFNHTSVAIALLGLDGNIIRVNETWQDLFGYSNNGSSFNNISEIYLPNKKNNFFSLINGIINCRDKQVRTQASMVKTDHSVIWVDQSISAVKNNKEEIQYFILTVMDITDRIEIENRFERERKLQQYFMEYLPDSIYFKDTSSRFIKANKATLIKMGLNTFDELIGKTDHDFFANEHSDDAKSDEEEIIKNGNSIINKIEKETWHDGSITWASTTKIPLRDDDNNIIGTFGITRDITDLKKSEDIRNALYKISSAVTSVPDIQNLYSTIHQIILDLMKADNFYIAMYNEESDTVSFPYFVDQIDRPPTERKAGRGLTEYILRFGKAQLIDAEMDMRLRASGETNLIGEPTQIWLGVPLKAEGKTTGVIVVQDYNDAKTYGENEKEILHTFRNRLLWQLIRNTVNNK